MSRKLSALAVVLFLHCGPPKAAKPVAPGAPAAAEAMPISKPPEALEPPQPTLRLPRNFVPAQYAARLVIDPARSTFDGAIEIAGKVTERSSKIWLHGYKLKVAKGVAQQDGAEIALTVTPVGTDLLEVRAAQPLAIGAWTLAFDYTGELDSVNTTGAFKQVVADHAYVYTQFEAIYARRVFPCVDEPDSKVPWKLTFDIPKALTVVANSPQVSEAPLGDKQKRVEFAQTKPLPSYLVAFGVGPFAIVDAGTTKGGTPIRIIALAKRGAEAAYAAKTSPRIVEIAEEWFGTPYPYEKLDMLAIPLTVGFGAMENAGLITYGETLILNDPVRPSQDRMHRWVAVAAHEVAHQWFGDLVTPVFWDDIWLNEGFAKWLERKVTTVFEPAWRDDQSDLSVRNGALEDDALVTARQIRQPIEDTNDILNAFDRITYDKGASVLNMFEHYVGPDVFQRGVREYLASRAWGNATSTDFIAAIGKAAGPAIAKRGGAPDAATGQRLIEAGFASFLEQPGAPEITATLQCGKDGKASIALAQQRYVPPGAAAASAGKPWILPVCVAYDKAGARGEACTMLDQPTGSLALPGKGCPRWVMPNADGRGYYRNAYTTLQINALRDEAWAKLSWIERRAVFFDVAEAATHGKLPLALSLSLVPRLLAGNDRFTVGSALSLVRDLGDLVPANLRDKFEYYLRQTFGPGAAQAGFLGKDTDTLDVEATRERVVQAVAWIGRDPKLIAEAVQLADQGWRDLPQSIRGIVLGIAVDARPALFDRVLRDVRTEPDRTRRGEMYRALSRVRDPGRQKQALVLVLDPKIDIRESIVLLGGGRGGGGPSEVQSRAIAQQFLRDNLEKIMKRMPSSETASPLAWLSYLFTSTCRAEQRDEIAAYVTKTFSNQPGGARIVRQAIESMDQCIASRKLLGPEVKAWMEGLKIPKDPAPAKDKPKAKDPASAKDKPKAKGKPKASAKK